MKAKIPFLVISVLSLACKSQTSTDQVVTATTVSALGFHYWKLIEVQGVAVTTAENTEEIYMIMTPIDKESGILKGHAGCNGLGGDYRIDGQNVSFQPITTKMYCESRMDMENAFLKMLTTANRYELNGRRLELYSGAELLGIFERKADN